MNFGLNGGRYSSACSWLIMSTVFYASLYFSFVDCFMFGAPQDVLSEPKARVWFEPPPRGCRLSGGVRLDRRTRMLYDARHVFINGESFRAGGADARLLRRLADRRELAAAELARLSPSARAIVEDWAAAGWLQEP